MEQTLEERRDSQLERLKNSVKMYENTLRATVKHMREEKNADGTPKYTEEDIDNKIKDIKDNGENDVITQYQQLGGDMEEIAKLVSDPRKEAPRKKKSPATPISLDKVYSKTKEQSSTPETIVDKFAKAQNKDKAIPAKEEPINVPKNTETIASKLDNGKDFTYFIPQKRIFDPTKSFDMIPLPSNGECYRPKIDSVAVEYLCGYDENMIFQPNLHRDGKVIDLLLKNKVLGDLDPMDMLEGDRDAIVLWLRATGYGNIYRLSLNDSVTGKDYEADVDLSTLKFKPFSLKGDENGWFDFDCPFSGDKIKFKFLTHREKKQLEDYRKYENDLVLKGEVLNMTKTIEVFLNANNNIDDTTKQYFRNAKDALNNAEKGIEVEDALEYSSSMSDQLELSIMSVNGNTDRKYISQYAKRMPIQDSFELRTFIKKNEPGVDFHFTVEKPESLGGGSQEVFLSVNSFVLLNFNR